MTNRIAHPEAELPIDTAARRLHSAGWNVGEVAATTHWLVTATNGENLIRAVADSQTAAWQLATEQARAVEMLRSQSAPHVVLKVLGKCDLPANEVIAWCSAMLDNDRVGFIARESLQSLRHRAQASAGR